VNVDARLEAGNCAVKETPFKTGTLALGGQSLVGLIDGLPYFGGRVAAEAGVTLGIERDVDEIAVRAAVRLAKVDGGGVAGSERREVVENVGRDRRVDVAQRRVRRRAVGRRRRRRRRLQPDGNLGPKP